MSSRQWLVIGALSQVVVTFIVGLWWVSTDAGFVVFRDLMFAQTGLLVVYTNGVDWWLWWRRRDRRGKG